MKLSKLIAETLLFSFSLLVLLGCGGSDGPQRYEVSGEVTLQGKPLENGTIEFDPQDDPKIPGGAVIEKGRYTISAEKGLPAGKYVVRIYATDQQGGEVEEAPGESRVLAKELIPAEYNTESTKTVEITADSEREFNFSIP